MRSSHLRMRQVGGFGGVSFHSPYCIVVTCYSVLHSTVLRTCMWVDNSRPSQKEDGCTAEEKKKYGAKTGGTDWLTDRPWRYIVIIIFNILSSLYLTLR